jgi:hypothetical protein
MSAVHAAGGWVITISDYWMPTLLVVGAIVAVIVVVTVLRLISPRRRI